MIAVANAHCNNGTTEDGDDERNQQSKEILRAKFLWVQFAKEENRMKSKGTKQQVTVSDKTQQFSII